MGFIDYHGNREDHYGEIVELSEMKIRREEAEKRRLARGAVFAELTGDDRYRNLEEKEALRQMRTAYQNADELFRSLAGDAQAWTKLWLNTAGRYIRAIHLPEETGTALLQTLMKKGFSQKTPPAEGEFFPLQPFQKGQLAEFWAQLCAGDCCADRREALFRLLDACGRCTACLAYYLCQLVNPEAEDWAVLLKEDLEVLRQQKRALRQRKIREALEQQTEPPRQPPEEPAEESPPVVPIPQPALPEAAPVLQSILPEPEERPNPPQAPERAAEPKEMQPPVPEVVERPEEIPLPSPPEEPAAPHRLYWQQTLLFRKPTSGREGEDDMHIDNLYDYLRENQPCWEEPRSLLPEEIRRQIGDKILPEFSDPSVSGLEPGEMLHYLDHGILFWERSSGEIVPVKGIAAFTEKRILFQGAQRLKIPYENLDRITRYDMDPEILAFVRDGQAVYLVLPEIETAYQVLKILAGRRPEEPVAKEKAKINYRELVEKADLDSCIFAYECLASCTFPQGMAEKLGLLAEKLKGLRRALENHPEYTEDTQRFFSYYIPEGARLAASCYEYQDIGLSQKVTEKLYAKIIASLDTLDAAVEQKLLSIYQYETMDTGAKADALRQILEQDGYSPNRILLNR